jgi:hypothetical protein
VNNQSKEKEKEHEFEDFSTPTKNNSNNGPLTSTPTTTHTRCIAVRDLENALDVANDVIRTILTRLANRGYIVLHEDAHATCSIIFYRTAHQVCRNRKRMRGWNGLFISLSLYCLWF